MSIKKQIVTAVATLALGAALIGGGTFAYFNSEVASTGNTFAAGSIDIANPNSGVIFSVANAKPGDSFGGTYTIKNSGTLNASLTGIMSLAKTAEGNGGDLGDALILDTLTIGTKDLLPQADANDDGIVSLCEAKSRLLNMDDINAGATTTFVIHGTFIDTQIPQNDLQGVGLQATFDFEARQK